MGQVRQSRAVKRSLVRGQDRSPGEKPLLHLDACLSSMALPYILGEEWRNSCRGFLRPSGEWGKDSQPRAHKKGTHRL